MTNRGAEIVSTFTQLERQIAGLICKGKRNPEIALALNVPCYIVKNHLKGVFDKAGVDCRVQFVCVCAEFEMFDFDRMRETA